MVMSMEKPEWISDMGTYNSLPKPHYEVTQHDFIYYLSIYSIREIEHRQLRDYEGYLDCYIFWFSDCALAILLPTEWDYREGETFSGFIYKKPIRYFYIGCKHDFEELSPEECKKLGIPHHGMCWHVVRCKKCGIIRAYDSSG